MRPFLEEARKKSGYTAAVRRHLHENPELTAREFHTVAFIQEELTAIGIPFTNIPDGGVLAWLDRDGQERAIQGKAPDTAGSPSAGGQETESGTGQAVLLRADCDALPIQESPNNTKRPKSCVSRVPGVAHACGHDAHTAMLLTAAAILAEGRHPFRGRIYFLFERGEEGGNCIYYVLKHIQERGVKIDACYGLHVDASIPTGSIGSRTGAVNAGNVNFEIRLIGKGGHASRPDLVNNPIDCFLTLGSAFKDLRMKYVKPDSPLIYSIGSVRAGSKRSIIPEELSFQGTVRFHSRESGLGFKTAMERMIRSVSGAYGCRAEFDVFTGPSFPVYNEPETTRLGQEAALSILEDPGKLVEVEAGMGSESFSTLSSFYPSSFFRIGVRNGEKGITAGAHTPEFDLDEEALPYGTALYIALALHYLREPREKPAGFVPYPGTADDFLKAACRPVPHRYDQRPEPAGDKTG